MMMDNIYDKAIEAAKFIESKIKQKADLAIVLGSGLGDFADELENKESIPFEDIPHFKKPTVHGHAGKLVFGKCGGRTIVCMQGRYHFYEGHHITEVVFPIRVFFILGIKKLVLTNAAGGLSKMLEPGDLMIIRDHINQMGTNPLIGPNDERFGPRFPDQSNIYNSDMQDQIADAMKSLGLGAKRGVYVAYSGPYYETNAEAQMFKQQGADSVGMSTIPEAIVGNHMGMKIAGISCITDMATGDGKPLDHKNIVAAAEKAKGNFKKILNMTIPKF